MDVETIVNTREIGRWEMNFRDAITTNMSTSEPIVIARLTVNISLDRKCGNSLASR